ncbi:MAG: CHAT domain-containing protein, partial [bacterium]|nr:CHAT domain-containing protein [bacterium]
MTIIYEVTIKTTYQENRFNITWHNVETNERHSFDSSTDITAKETGKLWQKLPHQLPIGQKLFQLLDGNDGYFQELLIQAHKQAKTLQIRLHTCEQTADWPFELMAINDTYLLPDKQLHLVRCVSDWGSEAQITPKNQTMKLLFMASSAMDVIPELDFEGEEHAIFTITEKLHVDIETEDSGSLKGLQKKLEQKKYDVIHLSGHADINEKGPYFIMENDTGHKDKVSPEKLWEEALIDNKPRLLFLSGCRTGETPVTPGTGSTLEPPHAPGTWDAANTWDTPDTHGIPGIPGFFENPAAVSFARLLVERYNIPAVMGWGRSVADDQAAYAGTILLRELSRGKSILYAVQHTRHKLKEAFPYRTVPAWPLLRIFSSGIPLDPVVQENQRRKPKHHIMKHVFLGNSRVKVLEEGFVGRRRQLQSALNSLEQDYYKVGLLLLGAPGLGKSCLAGKICKRFPHHTLIILHGKLDVPALMAALKHAFFESKDENALQMLHRNIPVEDKLAKLCASPFMEKNYLILLDDFEQNLEFTRRGKHPRLTTEAGNMLKALVDYLPLSGNMTQLIVTSRYDFAIAKREQDLVKQRLEKIWLTSFGETEILKKVLELEHTFDDDSPSVTDYLVTAGQGNPRLMEWLDNLADRIKGADLSRYIDSVKEEQENFICRYRLRAPLQQCSEELMRFL